MHRYNVDDAVKVSCEDLGFCSEVQQGDMIMVERDDGEWKTYDLEYIEEAIAKCQAVPDYENTTRYNFWNDMKTRAQALGVQNLTYRSEDVANSRAEMIQRMQPDFQEPAIRNDRAALARAKRRGQ